MINLINKFSIYFYTLRPLLVLHCCKHVTSCASSMELKRGFGCLLRWERLSLESVQSRLDRLFHTCHSYKRASFPSPVG